MFDHIIVNYLQEAFNQMDIIVVQVKEIFLQVMLNVMMNTRYLVH